MIVFRGAVHVWFHSYYVSDATSNTDLGAAARDSDGLFGVGPDCINILTGTPAGVLTLQVELVTALPALPQDLVAGECSLLLPSGKVSIRSPDDPPDWTHDFGSGLHLGIQVIAEHRDSGSEITGLATRPVEKHTLFLCPVSGPLPKRLGPAADLVLQHSRRRRSLGNARRSQ